MPLSFPDLETASFFSTTLVERPPPLDVVRLYVPSNPFASLAESDVPAVVLFSIAVGVALMGIERKGPVIQALHTLSEALMRVTRWIVRLTPAGVFAIAASAAGTMSIEDFGKVQVYLVSYIAFALLLTFWVLPGLVGALTGLPQGEVAAAARDALITAFATGSDFVVLPLLTERTKEILRKHRLDSADSDALVDVVIPVSHNFPHTAKILTLSFVLFAGWFTGNQLSPGDYPVLGAAGIVSTFGSVNLAIPFLLDLFHVPSDLFNLFVATSVVNARFGTLLAAMHGFSLALLVTCALTGRLSFSPARLVRFAALSALLVAGTTLAVHGLLRVLVDTRYQRDRVFEQMSLRLPPSPSVRVYRAGEAIPARALPGGSRLHGILASEDLRICYPSEQTLPFSYFHPDGTLVGFDVEMAHSLAQGLGVRLEFVPAHRPVVDENLGARLASGACDLALGTVLSLDTAKWVDFSEPYLQLTMALMVRDHRRKEFALRDRVERMEGLRLGLPDSPYYRQRVQFLLPNAEIVTLSSIDEALAAEGPAVDALVFVAEIGSAYSLLNPDWAVVVPDPPLQQIPMAFALPTGDMAWANYVNSWIELKKSDGTIDLLYSHWVLGRGAEPKQPRWSIARDVLGWMD
jgi:ABC-type amino acid transport substrate-binding protein